MKINSKTTKPELLAYIETLETELSKATATPATITPELVAQTAKRVWSEFRLLCQDIYRLGAYTRRQVQPALVYITHC